MTPPTPEEGKQVRVAQLGTKLFLVYVTLYGLFVFLAAFRSDLMSVASFAGVNQAITFGMVLIAGALVLAAVYMVGCKRIDQSSQDGKGQG